MSADRWLGVDTPEQPVHPSELPSSLDCESHAAAFDRLFYTQRIITMSDEEIASPPPGKRPGLVGNNIIMVRHRYELDTDVRLVRATIVSFGITTMENAYCLVEEGQEHGFWVHKLRVMDKNTFNPHFVEWPRQPGTYGQLKALASRLQLEL